MVTHIVFLYIRISGMILHITITIRQKEKRLRGDICLLHHLISQYDLNVWFRPKVCVLGSREQLCINQEVMRQESNHVKVSEWEHWFGHAFKLCGSC